MEDDEAAGRVKFGGGGGGRHAKREEGYPLVKYKQKYVKPFKYKLSKRLNSG